MKLTKLLTAFLVPIAAFAATSVSQYGITLEWTEDLTVGQYANGDYYIVAPSGATITSTTPASTLIDGRTKNGIMANPTAGISVQQGFDSSMTANSFNAALNVARPGGSDLSVGNPLVVSPGTSLVASISRDGAGVRPQLSDAAVFTFVSEAPPANSFRPPYCGTDKTPYWQVEDLDYTVLKSYTPVTGTPTIASKVAEFTRPWIEIRTEYGGREMHPENNQPDYGREIANATASAKLRLDLNDSDEDKEPLMIRLVQYGLDIYGAAVTGANWRNNGGHNMGRKLPIMLAAKALNDASILAYCDADQHFIFQEDQQTFYIAQPDVDRTTVGTDKPLASLSVSGGYLVATTLSAHSMAVERVVLLAGVTPSGYDGYYHVMSSAGTTATLRQDSEVAVPDLGAASVVGTMTYFSSWFPDDRAIAEPYLEGDIGTAEWGIRASNFPQENNFNWGTSYRAINDGPGLGTALGAILLEAETEWNWPAFFDYTDRQWAFHGSAFSLYPEFQKNMWITYRNGPPTAPFLSLATINSAGTSLTLVWSESCTNGGAGGNGITLDSTSGAVTATYSSGSGSDTYTYTVSPSVKQGAVVTVSYAQPGDGIEATVGSVGVESFSNSPVVNDSTAQFPAAMSNGSRQRLFPGGGF